MTLPGAPEEQREFLRHPLLDMLFIAAPSVVQMVSYSAMQFVDMLMVTDWGDDPIYVSAQGNGGFAVWIPLSLVFGMSGVVSSFVSQNLGANMPRKGAQYVWAQFWIAVTAALMLLPLIFVLPRIFGLLDHDPELIKLETGYANVLIYGAILTMGARTVAQYFFGMHKPVVPMVAALSGNVVNVLANWVLIFGLLGFPEMGLMGAALGTVIGSAVEMLIPTVIFLMPHWAKNFETRKPWRPSFKPIKDILRVGLPAGFMFVNEMICFGYLLVGLGGRFGPEQQAAGFIALRYMSLSFMPTVGLSIAITAIVGRLIGMGRLDLAEKRAWLGMGLGIAYMGTCATCFIVFREQLMGLFVTEDMDPESAAELVRVGSMILIAGAVFQMFDAIAVTVTGALRGAGDTFVPSLLTIVLSWLLIVGGGHLAVAIKPQWGAVGPWIFASAYIVVLGLCLLVRFKLGAWKRMKLSGDEVVI
ncbi:MAG: MATE family efflux transporter [Phycisphaerales bacterium JB064]